jgi:uncharacterized membrane protein YraQ (UPF0718 family)
VNLATLILILIAAAMLWLAWRRKDGSLQGGLALSWTSFRRTAPLLLIAFLIVGFVEVLAPQELISDWIGPKSGLRGILIGEIAGMLLPGGPYVVFPLIAALYEAGAGFGPALAMVTSWAGLALLSISFEIPFLGWRFTLIRLALTLPFPFLVGLVGYLLFT